MVGILVALPFLSSLYELKTLASRVEISESTTSETVFFESDERRIVGSLYVPAGPRRGYVVVAHGNRPAGKDHPLYRRLCSVLSRDNVLLAFDFRGYGESDKIGEHTNDLTLDFSSDVVSAVEFMAKRFSIDERDVILVGHSFGALNVILASKRLGSLQVIAVGTGNLSEQVNDESWAKNQQEKLSRIGLQVPLDRISIAYEPLVAVRIFEGLAPEDITFVWGESESGASELRPYIDSLNSVHGRVHTIVVPLADHMYWSEGSRGWLPRVARVLLGEEACEKALCSVITQSIQDHRRLSIELQN